MGRIWALLGSMLALLIHTDAWSTGSRSAIRGRKPTMQHPLRAAERAPDESNLAELKTELERYLEVREKASAQKTTAE